MAERVKKRSEIREQDTWKLEDMIESLEKFEELMDGVEERIQEYEAYREKLGNCGEIWDSAHLHRRYFPCQHQKRYRAWKQSKNLHGI